MLNQFLSSVYSEELFEECSDGFWAAVESITTRFPVAVMSDGRHIVVNFLKIRRRETIN